MAGEEPTNKALKFAWQGVGRPVDTIEAPNKCRVVIIGVGGAGNNVVTQLTKMGTDSAYTIAINTDSFQLDRSQADEKILIGEKVTHGLGAGGDLSLGKAAMEESRVKIEEVLDADIVFVTAGLGGGTGTGATAIVAGIAKKKGIITVGVVTNPLSTENDRLESASSALAELNRECDTVLVVDSNKLIELTPQIPADDVFKVADQVLASIIKGIVESISSPNLVNPDFVDFRTIVKRGGIAMVGIGESDASNRAEEAVRNALKGPLLGIDCTRATGALVYVTGDSKLTIEEANRVGEIVTEMMNNNAKVIWGAEVNPKLNGKIRVTLVMTGVRPQHTLQGFGSIAPQLFDLEPYNEPEKKLPVNLGLYQLENF